MADNIVTANPGAGGALFAVDLVSGTSTPFMMIATSNPVQVLGAIAVSTTVTIQGNVGLTGTSQVFGQISTFPHSLTGTSQVFGQVSSFPIGTTFANVMSSVPHAIVGTSMVNIVSSIALGFTPTGTSYVTLSSTQVSIGGGTQYVEGQTTTNPTGNAMIWKSAVSTMSAVSSSQPLPMNIVSTIPLGFTPTGTSYVTISSSQVALGGGQQYLDGSATTAPTGNVQMWKSGAAMSTMSAVSTTQPLPVFAISTNPHAISGTTQVNIVSSIALGFTPTGTSFVTISSSNLLAPLNQISSNIYIDGGAWAENAGKLAVIGGYYTTTTPVLGHGSTGAFVVNASSQLILAPGSAETTVSTTPLVRVGLWNEQDQQVTAFGGGQQYTDGSVTTAPTGNALMWKSLVSTMAVVSSSRPLPINIVSTLALSVTQTGTSYVTISSTQVAIGGGTQYLDGGTTSTPTGTITMYRSGNSSQTMSAVGSSTPLPTFIASSIALGFTPTGTSYVTLSSSQVSIGGGTQYLDGTATTGATGNVMMWTGGNSSGTVEAISTSQPLPVYQISTAPWGPIQGTTMVNIVSTVVQIVSGQVSSFANNVASTFVVGSVSQSTTPIPATQGGLDVVFYTSVTTSPKAIKNSAGRLYDIWFTNSATSSRWLSLFNQSSAAASTGTTVPLMRFGLPGGTSAVSGWLGSAFGYQFSTAISCSVTASSATTTDTSAPGTNEVLLNFGFR